VEHKNKEKIIYLLAKITNALAISANPKMSIIPAQKTNHSLEIVMFTR
jgi:hypothetical protein